MNRIYIESGLCDETGYRSYSCGTLHAECLHADSRDVDRYSGKSALTQEERVSLLFAQRFSR